MKKITVTILIAALFIPAGLAAQANIYIIKKGDTLYSVSKKFNIKLDSLKSENNIEDPSKLYPGMEIVIPGGYTVEKGDTLYSIARKYATTVDELRKLNDMSENSVLLIGQFIHVPADSIPLENGSETEIVFETDNSVPADTVEPNVIEQSEWPHAGERTVLTGKLKGIQITGLPGDQIKAVSGGRVVWASDYGIYKKLILIEATNGIVYGYGGNERTSVRVGDYVSPGSIIGVLGGHEEKSNAFFFVYKNGKPLDPEKAPRV